MASAGPQPTPQQMAALQQQMMEAQKRGMTPQQFQAMQRKKIEEEAAKHGMTFDQYINKMKQDALASHQRQQQMLAQQQQQQSGQPGPQQGQEVPITPGAPDPKALAVAKWLRSQDLKTRTCILNGQRRDMFRGKECRKVHHQTMARIGQIANMYSNTAILLVKRAIRAIESPEYTAAQKKNPLLPTPPATKAAANEVFKLLPLSLLALRVTKIDPHTGHGHGKTKRVKGLWTVKIEQQQDISDDLHYVWLYDGPQWRTKLYAAGAVLCIFAVVLFPLWPLFMRVGVWYLSMAFLGLLGLFFAMSIFRLILFCITVVTMPKGLWLYPNLFEDVGFFDSFRPVWAWQEVNQPPLFYFLFPLPSPP